MSPAKKALEDATLAETECSATAKAAEKQLQTAVQESRESRLQYEYAFTTSSLYQKSEILSQLQKKAGKAKTLRSELSEAHEKLTPLPVINAADVESIRQLHQDHAQAEVKLEAMATGIELVESSELITIDGEVLEPKTTKILTDAAELTVGKNTRISIRPGGGTSLSEAHLLRDKKASDYQAALSRLTLRDQEHAISVLRQRPKP